MTNDLIHIYCMLNSPPEFPETMIRFKNLKSLVFGDFYVVVESVSSEEFSEGSFNRNLSDIEWLETHARKHTEVISILMDKNTAIPFKFGTTFNAENDLEKFITDYSDSLLENLLRIEGKEEWGVKIYCNRKLLSEQIDELSEETAGLEKQIMASSPGKAFLLKRKKNELVENEMDRICKSYGQDYYNEFRKLSISTILNNLLPKKISGRGDTMVLNANFLVNKTKADDFRNTVDTVRKDGISSFIIETTGPGPPFLFVYIKENQ